MNGRQKLDASNHANSISSNNYWVGKILYLSYFLFVIFTGMPRMAWDQGGRNHLKGNLNDKTKNYLMGIFRNYC